MGKYTKNSKGLYRTGVLIGYDEAGRMKRKWLSARTIAELERKIAEVKLAIDQGRDLLNENVLFKDYATRWLEVYKKNAGLNTRQMYEHVISHLEPLYAVRVRDIRPMHLQALINDHSAHARTCEQMEMTLKQIFNQAIADDIIVKNPAASLELPRHVKKEKRALTPEEEKAVKSAALTPRQRAFLMIAYGCGLRPGEIYALTWQDIDFKNSCVHVNKSLVFEKSNRAHVSLPKTNKSIRSVEAPELVMRALREYRSTTIAPKLFGGKQGGYGGMTFYLGEWKKIKAKIEEELGHKTDLTMYCFRHNYASMLYYANISPKEAQRLMGHTSYRMIMEIYAHLDAVKESTSQKLNAIIV